MKKNKIVELIDKFGKANLYVTIFVFVIVVTMSVCYAEYAELVATIGQVTIEAPKYEVTNIIEFINFEVIDSPNEVNNITIDNKSISDGFNVITNIQSEIINDNKYHVKYTLYNGTTNILTYFGSEGVFSLKDESDKSLEIKYPEIYGITKGDLIQPGESHDVNVIFTLDSEVDCNKNLDAELVFTFKQGDIEVIKPKIIGNINDNHFLLNEDNIAEVSIDITNLYDCANEVTISLSNLDIEIIDDITKLIVKDDTEKIKLTLKLNDNYQSQVTSSIIVTTKTGETYNLGDITLYKE